ncbi:hypothetical protein ILUMI_14855, partial [Ignelater luminosus]
QIPRRIPPETELGLQIATCLPSACTADDIEKIYKKLHIPLKIDEALCQTKVKERKLDNGDIVM